MNDPLPRVTRATVTSVDGRITLRPGHLLLDDAARRPWEHIVPAGALADRDADLDTSVVLGGSGSFVPASATAPDWPEPTLSEAELRRDHVPRPAQRCFVVADSRGRVDWSFTGDDETRLHVLVCRSTPLGYLQRLP